MPISQWGHYRLGSHHQMQQEPSQGSLGRSMSHHHWHECKDMAARLGYRHSFGCWCPQRHPSSWKCPRDWLWVLLEPWLLSGAGTRVRCQSCLHVRARAISPCHQLHQQWIKGLMKTRRAWTPSVALCHGRVKQGLCSTA